MEFYMEVLIIGVIFSTWFLLLLAVSYRVYRVKHQDRHPKSLLQLRIHVCTLKLHDVV